MNKLTNGTQYRATNTGYIVTRGGRTLYINAKSAQASQKARELIANVSFNKLHARTLKAGGINYLAIK